MCGSAAFPEGSTYLIGQPKKEKSNRRRGGGEDGRHKIFVGENDSLPPHISASLRLLFDFSSRFDESLGLRKDPNATPQNLISKAGNAAPTEIWAPPNAEKLKVRRRSANLIGRQATVTCFRIVNERQIMPAFFLVITHPTHGAKQLRFGRPQFVGRA